MLTGSNSFSGYNATLSCAQLSSAYTLGAQHDAFNHSYPLCDANQFPYPVESVQQQLDNMGAQMQQRNSNVGFNIGNAANKLYHHVTKTASSYEALPAEVSTAAKCNKLKTSFYYMAQRIITNVDMLSQAITLQDLGCIRQLASEFDINEDRGCIKQFLASKFDINGSCNRETYLDKAFKTENPAVVELLLDLGANMYVKGWDNQPLFLRGLRSQPKIAELILAHLDLSHQVEVGVKIYVLEMLLTFPEFFDVTLAKIQSEGIRLIDLPYQGARALCLAIVHGNINAINLLLEHGVDMDQRVTNPEVGLDATARHVAMVSSNREIRKIFKTKRERLPEFKNQWTTQFENIINMMNDSRNHVEFVEVTNEFGNTFYDPIFNGEVYPLHEISLKMDWRQVNIHNLGSYGEAGIKSYISGYSIQLNAFMKGEPHYTSPLNFPYSHQQYWRDIAQIATELNNRPVPDEDQLICRGQSQEDRLVRHNHISFISTSSNLKLCRDYQKNGEPILILDENQGIDVTDLYRTSQHIYLPTPVHSYEYFVVEKQKYHFGRAGSQQTQPEPTAQDHTQTFEHVINQVVNGKGKISTQAQTNRFGQTFYNIIIDDVTYDMYEITSNMDWRKLSLSQDTIEALEQSPYRLWDEQTYTNYHTFRSSAAIVNNPVKLTDIDSTLAGNRQQKLQQFYGEQATRYSHIYNNLTQSERGLVFQYTTGTYAPLNSFLRGSVAEFESNIPAQHQKRWNSDNTEFRITDPLQWWVYAARFVNALNRIKPVPMPPRVCRGQTHMDRHLRLTHAAPISTSSDFKLCMEYNTDKGDLVVLKDFNAPDITGLSFHPDQREFLHPPALLVDYKKRALATNKGYLEAKVKPSRTIRPRN